MELMRGIAIFYYWTWFIWPFVLVFSLVYGISSMIKDENQNTWFKCCLAASISLLVILAGISPDFN